MRYLLLFLKLFKLKEKIGLICIGDIENNTFLDFLKFNEVKITYIMSFKETCSMNKLLLIWGIKFTFKNQLALSKKIRSFTKN